MRPLTYALLGLMFFLLGVLLTGTANASDLAFLPPDMHRPPQNVPEPPALIMLATGVAALAVRYRRRK